LPPNKYELDSGANLKWKEETLQQESRKKEYQIAGKHQQMFQPKINENSRKLAECIDRTKYGKKKPVIDYSRYLQASRNPPQSKAATVV
jgi:hypothetical protein